MLNIPSDSSSKFLTFLGLLIIYGGVTYAWTKIESIETRRIDIQTLSIEYEDQQEMIDEITDARDDPIIINIIKKDSYLFKKYVDSEFFDEEWSEEEEREFSKRLREAMYSSPDEIAQLVNLRAPSRKDLDELDGLLLGLKVQKQRLELEENSLVNSERFYWVYLLFSIFLGLTFMILGLFSWKRDESKAFDSNVKFEKANKSMHPTAKASDE